MNIINYQVSSRNNIIWICRTNFNSVSIIKTEVSFGEFLFAIKMAISIKIASCINNFVIYVHAGHGNILNLFKSISNRIDGDDPAELRQTAAWRMAQVPRIEFVVLVKSSLIDLEAYVTQEAA